MDEVIFDSIYIITELLYHDLEKNKSATSYDYVSEFLNIVFFNIRVKLYSRLIAALEYLMKMKLVHMDIKPANMMLNKKPTKTNQPNLIIKLIDFGLATKRNN